MPVQTFLRELARATRTGVVQQETEQHIRHSFRKIGRHPDLPSCITVVDETCTRLAAEIARLRELQHQLIAAAEDQPL